MSFSILLSALAVISTASATSGKASFYGGNTSGGACSFADYTLPSGIDGTALSSAFWNGSAQCGACISATGPLGSVTVMVVDECPGGCNSNDLDLFQSAFTNIGTESAGIIDITWEYVACPITTPVELKNKEGVSANWFSMQARNANQAVSSLETSSDGGSTWDSTTRQDYNYFENSSGVGSTVDVRITAKDGSVVTVKDVAVSPSTLITASEQFSTSGLDSADSSSSSNTSSDATSDTKTSKVATSKASKATKKPVAKGLADKKLAFGRRAYPVNATMSKGPSTATGSYYPGIFATVASTAPAAASSSSSADWKDYADVICTYERAVDSALHGDASDCNKVAGVTGSASNKTGAVAAETSSSQSAATSTSTNNAAATAAISSGTTVAIGKLIGSVAVGLAAFVHLQ